MGKHAEQKEESDNKAGPVVSDQTRQLNRAMIWWCIGTVSVVGSTWFLLKGDGRQLVAAPGELLITISRPAAIEPPYPVEDLGGQWGLLVLGELKEKYARMTAMFGLWTCGAAILFGVFWRYLPKVGMRKLNRVVLSLAGLAVFAAGVLLLQAAFRSGVNYRILADVGGLDPFKAAQALPLSLATKACVWLSVASLLLATTVGLIIKTEAIPSYLAASYRLQGMRWCIVLALAALIVLPAYALMTLIGPIPDTLQLRLDVLTEAKIVNQMNEIWGGLKWAALAVQLGGLLWVVLAWVAPGRPDK